MILTKKKMAVFTSIIIILMIAAIIISKKISPISLKLWGEINTNQNVAVQGYDVVNYQRNHVAVLGDSQQQINWNGVLWHFASEANKNLFMLNPKKYAPQYGGYCSFAVSKGVTADSDPKVWHIENNKLYLFMDSGVKKEWIANKGVIASDKNWEG